MVGFDDHGLEDVPLHPQSVSKAPPMKKTRKDNNSNPKSPPLPPAYGDTRPGSHGAEKGGNGTGGAVTGGKNLAASLYPWDCDVYDFTDSVLLLTTTKDPTVIVKLQSEAILDFAGVLFKSGDCDCAGRRVERWG